MTDVPISAVGSPKDRQRIGTLQNLFQTWISRYRVRPPSFAQDFAGHIFREFNTGADEGATAAGA